MAIIKLEHERKRIFMKISIIGCGNMGSGIATRLSETNQLFLYDHSSEKTEILAKKGYGKAYQKIDEALNQSEMIILAVKPDNIKEAGELIKNHLRNDQIIVSLITGITIETLQSYFPNVKVIRMMPNLAVIYGEGVVGLSSNEKLEKEEKDHLTKIFSPLGKIHWMPEEKINALTALAGSGPGFVFAIVEAMADSGIAMGFSSEDSKNLVCQMLRGSLTLLEQTGKHPGELKWQVTSPKGTTIAGLKKLEESAIRGGIMNTFLSAYERANELSVNEDVR